GLVAFHEIGGSYDFIYFFSWKCFAGLIMLGETTKEFLLIAVVFHQLRGKLYEIPIDIGSRKAFENSIGKNIVQGMYKIMQQCTYFREGMQRRVMGSRPYKIKYDGNVRSMIPPLFFILSFIGCHPFSGTFSFTRVLDGIG